MKIAVVGGGISGLSCAWLLSAHHPAREHLSVTLFEKNDYLGGHTNTVDATVDGLNHPVDTGFLVCNDWTYPNLLPMFATLGVETAPSDMSFGIKLTDEAFNSRLEWCGSDDLSTTFAQPTNLFRPRFLRMLKDLLRFNREATLLADSRAHMPGTLGEYLDRHGYSRAFRDWYLVPMAACIWSTPTKCIDDFPLATFITFCRNHGLISVNNRPQWRTVKGGARTYVRQMQKSLQDVRLNAQIQRITRTQRAGEGAGAGAGGITIHTANGTEQFDQLVLACHSDQAIALLGDITTEERDVLAQIPYQDNVAVLHTDVSVLPTRRRAWAAWNYQAFYERDARGNDSPVSLTYLLNKLQPLPFTSPVMVTMNPMQRIDPAKVLREIRYEHPLFLAESSRAKQALRRLQGRANTWFAGAWTRYGFHEDGLMSGIAVAQALGAQTPWETNVPAADDLQRVYPGVDDVDATARRLVA
ncbi:MAG: NAD(P)/FAD-dependent oxidoreductase [Burkholderiales bacterium]